MSFDGKEGSVYTLTQAAELTAHYRKNNESKVKAVFYGREALLALLNQEGSMGIRFYFGESDDEEAKRTLVLVSADANENDQMNLIYQQGRGCPKSCGGINVLNS